MKQKTKKKNEYHRKLKKLMDDYAHFVYRVTKNFPKEEVYGIISQLRRAALSVILNYIEGFARGIGKSNDNFMRISYGSLKESKYLLHFSLTEGFLSMEDYKKGVAMAEEIGAMLWGCIKK